MNIDYTGYVVYFSNKCIYLDGDTRIDDNWVNGNTTTQVIIATRHPMDKNFYRFKFPAHESIREYWYHIDSFIVIGKQGCSLLKLVGHNV